MCRQAQRNSAPAAFPSEWSFFRKRLVLHWLGRAAPYRLRIDLMPPRSVTSAAVSATMKTPELHEEMDHVQSSNNRHRPYRLCRDRVDGCPSQAAAECRQMLWRLVGGHE